MVLLGIAISLPFQSGLACRQVRHAWCGTDSISRHHWLALVVLGIARLCLVAADPDCVAHDASTGPVTHANHLGHAEVEVSTAVSASRYLVLMTPRECDELLPEDSPCPNK